jgi:hypothetical protein
MKINKQYTGTSYKMNTPAFIFITCLILIHFIMILWSGDRGVPSTEAQIEAQQKDQDELLSELDSIQIKFEAMQKDTALFPVNQ